MNRTVDLNADLGEGFPWDEPLLDRVTSANICCGAHAGDPDTILRTLRWAGERDVVVGAHPGYEDREGFGRRDQSLTFAEVGALVERQLIQFKTLAYQAGVPIRYLKPHGALYNQAQRQDEVANAILNACVKYGLPILGQPGGEVERWARLLDVPFIPEGYVDRRYLPDGMLLPRAEPGAVLEDPGEIRDQVLDLIYRGVRSLCVHGDDARSVALADLVLSIVGEAGIEPVGFA